MSKNKDVRRGISLYIDGKEVEGSVKSIKAEMRKLVREQELMAKGSKEYIEQGKKIRQLKAILAEHNQQLNNINKTQDMSLSKGVDLFNKYAASATAVIAALTGVVLKLNQLRNLSMEREESKADLKALTGLDDGDINWLEQKAIELSTTVTEEGVRIRQSATEILEAYKLVGSAKPDLLENRDALAEVTRETLVLASASGMKLTDAVDAATLSLNQYGADANEASRYVNVLAAGSKVGAAAVESITKVVQKAGVSAAASDVSIEQLVGTVETLAEKGIKNEEAGTALKNFFLTLQTGADETNPKVVGLQTALENLNKKQMDATEIKKMFGKETFNVASVLISGAEKVKYYTDAVTGTNIAYEQAAIKSDTLKAKLDQVKNAMNEQGIELMKELNPAINKVLGSLVNWSKHTVKLVKFISDHRAALSLLVTGIIAYNLWINRKIILDKLSVFWTEKLVVANKSLNAALKANPWMLAITILTVVIGLLVDYQRKLNKTTQTMRSLESINKKTADEYGEQASKIDILTLNINNNNLSLERRRTMLDQLKAIVPGYNAQLDEEGKLINNNTDAIKEYLKQLEKKIKFKAAEDELEELFKQQRDVTKRLEKEREEMNKAHQNLAAARFTASMQSSKAGTSGTQALNAGLNQSVKQMETLHGAAVKIVSNSEKELKELAESIEDVNKELAASGDLIFNPTTGADGVCPKCGNKPCTCDAVVDNDDRIKKELERLESEHLSKMTALKERYLNDSTFTQDEYNQEIERLELELLQSKMDIAGLELSQQQKLLDQLYNLKIQARDKVLAMQKKKADDERKAMEQAHKEKISLLDRQQKEEVMKLIDKRMTENLTEEEYNRQLKELIVSFLDEKLSLDSLSDDERLNLQSEKQQIELENFTEHAKQLREKQEEYRDFIEDISEAMGATLGEMFAGNEEGMRGMLKNMLTMILDYLEKVVLASIGQVTITSFTSLAGAAKAMGKIIAIKAAFSAVKSAIGNFYTGGYTGHGDWDEPQGIVHSNEFVANRYAVANPSVRPVLDLLDHAQRSGSISNLTSADIAAVSGTGNRRRDTVVVNPVASSAGASNNNADMRMINECVLLMRQLKTRFENPIIAETYATGKKGTIEAQNLVDKMEKNVSR